MEQFERIRREHRGEGVSIRGLSDRHGVHRRTVRQAIKDAVPPVREPPQRQAPVLGPYVATIRGWLVADLDAPRKQRHTARRIWQRLIEEEGAVVAESSVRNLVAQLRTEVGPGRQVMVPQTHPPATEAEVDFGEFRAVIAGAAMKLFMFCLRLSHSGKAVHVAYANQAQESFLDGHVRAFEALGGVPVGMIRYEAAVVLSVDEKSQVQALGRSQPAFPMMPGMPEKRTHDYVRHGTTSLFAAFNTADGTVISRLHRRHRAVEFKKFLAKIDDHVPEALDVHLICDNYGTHKQPTVNKWLAAHPRFHMHFTPTYSSWINQVERFFAYVTADLLRRSDHRSVQALEADIRNWVKAWNENPQPFIWTNSAEQILASLGRLLHRTTGA